MYIGSYVHNIDDKNRLSIPKKWKEIIGNTIILTCGLDGSLFLYDDNSWAKILENMNKLSFLDKDSRNFSRFLLANAFEIDIDSHGRILIPESLRSLVKLQIEVCMIGVGDRIELWPKDIFEKQMSSINSEIEDLAERIYDIQSK